jgi:hypothetical protein
MRVFDLAFVELGIGEKYQTPVPHFPAQIYRLRDRPLLLNRITPEGWESG